MVSLARTSTVEARKADIQTLGVILQEFYSDEPNSQFWGIRSYDSIEALGTVLTMDALCSSWGSETWGLVNNQLPELGE